MNADNAQRARQREAALTAQVSRDNLMEINTTLAQWVRNSGTPEERQAFDYMQQLLDGYGLETTLLEHPAFISYPLEASLTIWGGAGEPDVAVTCLGTAMSVSADALEAEVIDLGFGTAEDYARAGQEVAGKIVLLNGLATPTAVYAAEKAGSVGQIFINDDHLHYMIVSSVWGAPTPESAKRLPTTPSLSVVEEDGHDLRRRIAAGPVRVRLSTEVFREWTQTPILVAELPGTESDDFVLFSGHLDSWEVGAMDNGAANATMAEAARILSANRQDLRRGLRIAFWSGHSHGRYSGSTWYVDHHWEELYDRCVAHVNVDSTGARGATFYGAFPAHMEIAGFGEEIVQRYSDQEPHAHRMSRAGDMSFNGVGLPSLFMGLSQVPTSEADTDYVSLAFGSLIGGKMPWWWHTSEDTIDKIDPDVLALDTRIYVSVLWNLCAQPLLPMDFRRVAADIADTLAELQSAAGDHLDLSLTHQRAVALAEATAQLAERCAAATNAEAIDDTVKRLNAQMMALSRILIPLTYTAAGQFEHDPAWGMPHLPALHDARRLIALPADSDDFRHLQTQLVRARNKVNIALRDALRVLAE
ncbi:MAG: M28 family peptidase [Chloroflexota bacterium]|nr:M28 family peptidase [Chloroflexota bacterium]